MVHRAVCGFVPPHDQHGHARTDYYLVAHSGKTPACHSHCYLCTPTSLPHAIVLYCAGWHCMIPCSTHYIVMHTENDKPVQCCFDSSQQKEEGEAEGLGVRGDISPCSSTSASRLFHLTD